MCVHFKICCIGLAGIQINNPINHFCDIKGFIPSVLIGIAFWDPVGAFFVVDGVSQYKNPLLIKRTNFYFLQFF